MTADPGRSAGLLEGIHKIAQKGFAWQRLHGSAVHHIALSKEFGDIDLESRVFKHADRPAGIKINQHVDVTVRPGFAARHGPKHRGMQDATPAEFHLVPLERFQRTVELYRHLQPESTKR